MRGVVQMMAELDILNGFVGKIISDCIDISINKIRKADKNRKSKNQTMETRIYQVTVDALNVFPYNKYKKDEKVYDAVESILNELKRGNGDYKESVRLGLNMLSAEITGDICEDFLELLCYEICKEENRDLAIGYIIRQEERISAQQQQMDRYMQEGFEENNQNHEETHRKLDYLIEKRNGKEIQGVKYLIKSPVVNRADEYAQRWDKNVFLNNFNEEDENSGINIKLGEIYVEECLPHYIWKTNTKSSNKLKNLLAKYVININNKKMLLILGQPGIGKSTLITWIMANLVENIENILVYQFASDFSDINWQGNNLLHEIFVTVGLKYSEIEGKTLILDGFDEIYVQEDRERILHKLNQELEKGNYLEKISLIITCRENYVDHSQLYLEGIEYITLQAWDELQIRSFCEVYEETIIRKDLEKINKNSENRINKIIEKKDIMGIPLILYMVLALNVDIERSVSTVDIYDQIFSLRRGGIYDRGYDVEHRINDPEIKKYVHHISQRIAFWIFENNSDRASIPQEKFVEICNKEMSESGEYSKDVHSDVLIGNYFKSIKHCDGLGTKEIQFVHRSIYEYFVVIYFLNSVHNLTSKEKVAGKLGELLKNGYISKQMLEFIKYKFNNVKRMNLASIIRDIFQIMVRDGMLYHVEGTYKNAIEQETNIFANMLEIVGLWNATLGKCDDRILIYLKCNIYTGLNLKGIQLDMPKIAKRDLSRAIKVYLNESNLSGAYLRGTNFYRAKLSRINFSKTNLRGANLCRADLGGSNLSEADLRGANLRETNLNGTNLSKANLRGANLRGADLSGANLNEADLSGADLREVDLSKTDLKETIFGEEQVNMLHQKYNLSKSKVFFNKKYGIISYQEFCDIKNKIWISFY